MNGKTVYGIAASGATVAGGFETGFSMVGPLLAGLLAVILMRMLTTAKESHRGWDYYNVCLTAVLALIVVVVIIDRKLGTGGALIAGMSIGAAGVTIVDIFRSRGRAIVAALFGSPTPPEPPPGDDPR